MDFIIAKLSDIEEARNKLEECEQAYVSKRKYHEQYQEDEDNANKQYDSYETRLWNLVGGKSFWGMRADQEKKEHTLVSRLTEKGHTAQLSKLKQKERAIEYSQKLVKESRAELKQLKEYYLEAAAVYLAHIPEGQEEKEKGLIRQAAQKASVALEDFLRTIEENKETMCFRQVVRAGEDQECLIRAKRYFGMSNDFEQSVQSMRWRLNRFAEKELSVL